MIAKVKEFLSEGKSIEYIQKRLKIQSSDIGLKELGIKICTDALYDDYVMYENGKEISIGIGQKIAVTVEPDLITVRKEDKVISVEMNDINNDVHDVFKSVSINNWRAYGIANFGLAYYNYKLPMKNESSQLLKLFIPKIDIRLTEQNVLIRAFNKEDINGIMNIINDFEKNKLYSTENKENCNKHISDTLLKEQKAEQYKNMVAKAVSDIKNVKYQKVILSRKVVIDRKINMSKSYLLGRKENNPARSYYIKLNGLQVIGYSPETVAEVDENKIVSTFPLAGTRAIGENKIETERLKKELLTDPKEIAEHAVSVKLAYEELAKVCEEKTVYVSQFMNVLERGTVQHLASRLKGKIKEGFNEWHAFNMLFPAVTASGIPKKECLEAISEIEKEARDLYSGSVITYDQNGSLDAALVLRSVYQDDKLTWLRAGAGIVKMSLPKRELEETREKLSSVSQQLIELKQGNENNRTL